MIFNGMQCFSLTRRKTAAYGLCMSKNQIVISGVPTDLLKDIDTLAKKDSRKRSDIVRLLLREIVATKRAAGFLKAA